MTTPFLSIVIPAYNEELRLPNTLQQVFQFTQEQRYTCEVLVVENGSHDRTLQIARDFAASHPEIRVMHEERRGKGLAVQHGMLAARGEYRFMCDADLSMPVEEINRFLPPALQEFDIAIASREAKGSIRFNEPHYRHLGGRLVNTMIRWLALPGLHDTQCGFKCFRAGVAEDIFRVQTLSGFSFDIELLFIARLRKYRILEIPIPWYFSPDSKVSVIGDAMKMGLDILRIHRNALAGAYHAKV